MNFEIQIKHTPGTFRYYINLTDKNYNSFSQDAYVASIINLSVKEYADLLLQFNGYKHEDFYFFYEKEDIERFIEEVIEPRLLMTELSGENDVI